MLRILHTADWHLGQSFLGYERDYEHDQFLTWLLQTLQERATDVLLIAGDIFDSINPPATAQRRFFNFLARAYAAAPKLQVVLIAGNHDAAARLEAPARLLESFNVTVVGTVERDPAGEIVHGKFLVPLRDPDGQVRAIAVAVPFLRPSDVPNVLEATDPHLDGVRELYKQAVEEAEKLRDTQYPDATLIALGHCHLRDAVPSPSERNLLMGGSAALHADTFPATLAYVALGHLHKPQELAGGRIHYCGSPLPLSFSEKDYDHRVLEILIDGAPPRVSPLPVPRTSVLMRIPETGPAPIAEVLELLEAAQFDASLPPAAQPFLEVRVLAEGPDTTRRQRIAAALEGKAVRLASIKVEQPLRDLAGSGGVGGDGLILPLALETLDPEEILLTVYRDRFRADPAPEMLAAFREILQQHAYRPEPDVAA